MSLTIASQGDSPLIRPFDTFPSIQESPREFEFVTLMEAAGANPRRHVGPSRSRYLFALALIILSLVVIQPIMGTSTQSNLDVSWLHTAGTHIYNENGEIVDLHGVNLVSGQWEGIYLGDIQNAKQLGFNAFRYQAYWENIQPYNETLNGIDETDFTTGKHPLNVGLDQLVNWAIQENMYFIICLWWTPTYPPPQWAFHGLSDDTQRYAALINGTAAKERTGFINTWKYIANRYKNVPNVIFELLNEPDVLGTSLAGNAYETFNEQVISAIESVETQPHLKIVELLLDDWMEITDGASDVDKSNVLWATHHYAPQNYYDLNGKYWHDSFTWHGQYFPSGWGNVTTMVAWRTIRVAEKIRSWNKPWIATEFSKNVTQAYWQIWYDTTLQTMTDYGISGWMFYCYDHDPTLQVGWNLGNPSIQPEIMTVLEPYLELTPFDNQTSTSTTSSSTTPTSTTSVVTSSSTSSTPTSTSTTSSSTTASVSSSTSKVSAQMFTAVDSGLGSVTPNCSSGCSETVGSQVTVTANPSSGWLFSGWSTQNGESCSSNPCTFNMPNNQVTLKATFTQIMRTLTTNVASGSGSVSPNCPSGCQQQVGSSVSVSATATSGWTFSSWTVTGESCSGGSSSNSCTFTMPNNAVTVSATFTQITVTSTTTSVSSSTMTTLSSTTNSTVSSTTTSAVTQTAVPQTVTVTQSAVTQSVTVTQSAVTQTVTVTQSGVAQAVTVTQTVTVTQGASTTQKTAQTTNQPKQPPAPGRGRNQ